MSALERTANRFYEKVWDQNLDKRKREYVDRRIKRWRNSDPAGRWRKWRENKSKTIDNVGARMRFLQTVYDARKAEEMERVAAEKWFEKNQTEWRRKWISERVRYRVNNFVSRGGRF